MTSKATYRRTEQTTEFVKGRRYEYNLQNRLAEVWDFGEDESPNTIDDILLVEYQYNPSGVRAEKIDYEASPVQLTTYHIDPSNHTGYAQVIEETTYDDDGQGGWTPFGRIQYTIGYHWGSSYYCHNINND